MEHKQQVSHPSSLRVQKASVAMAHAVTYGLIHNLHEAIERNRRRGWADDDLHVFRLGSDDEVREAWQLFLSRRERGQTDGPAIREQECSVCGRSFTAVRESMYCSVACQMRAFRQRLRERSRPSSAKDGQDRGRGQKP
jgi:hypothetical protein